LLSANVKLLYTPKCKRKYKKENTKMTEYLKFAEKSEAEYYEDEQQKDNGTYGLRNACDGNAGRM